MSVFNITFRDVRKPTNKVANPQKLEFPKKVELEKAPVNRFANESVKRSKPVENQMANLLKYNSSKGGLRDRSRDYVSTRIRDPSIKFPGTIRGPTPVTKNDLSRDVTARPNYYPSPCSVRDNKENQVKKLAKFTGVAFPKSLRKKSLQRMQENKFLPKASVNE